MKYAIALLLIGCAGKPPPVVNIENAAALAQYTALLEGCRAKGKAAGSYAVYEACADAIDQELCAVHGLRCPDGAK